MEATCYTTVTCTTYVSRKAKPGGDQAEFTTFSSIEEKVGSIFSLDHVTQRRERQTLYVVAWDHAIIKLPPGNTRFLYNRAWAHTTAIHMHNPTTNFWEAINHMTIPRWWCISAVLPDN